MTSAIDVIRLFRALSAQHRALFSGTISERLAIHVAFVEALHQLRQGVPMTPLVEQELVGGTSEEWAIGAQIVEILRRSNMQVVAHMALADAAAAKARARGAPI